MHAWARGVVARLRRPRRPSAGLGLAMAGVGVVALLAGVVPPARFPDSYGTVVLDRRGEVLGAFLAPDQQWRFPWGAVEVSPKLVEAVLTYEDRRFFRHPGIDAWAVGRALLTNLRAGRVKQGASTLTMQVARLADPKSRNVWHKALEMFQAIRLELTHSKSQILAMYLAHAPYGRNVVGVGAASYVFFGRPPSRLTWAEAATLAVLPRSPSRVNPWSGRELLLARRNALLRELHRRGKISHGELAHALAEPLPEEPHPMPFLAPHACRRVAGRRGVVRTTIDGLIQERVEELANLHSAALRRRGIHNVAVLVAETKTGAVRAYVGSGDFWDEAHGGQVDGVVARRSTGSLLKPFLYAMAMDAGLIHPLTLVRDVPVHYGAYAPVNADGGYRGLVSAKEALAASLNVPPTILLQAQGVAPFFQFLKAAGMTTLFRRPEEYGLALILGGAEGTLWDMVRLFRGLGCMGRFGPLTLTEEQAAPGPALLSPAAAWMTLDMLTAVRRPEDEGVDWTVFSPRRRVAWKTGTSFGRRDGWAVGVTPTWTVGVWAGNFSGEGNPFLGGTKAAAPLMFSVLEALPAPDGGWFPPPEGAFRPVTLCALTGYRAGPACPQTLHAQMPAQAPPLPTCPYHREVLLDASGRFQVCSRCWRSSDSLRREIRVVVPAHVLPYLRGPEWASRLCPPHLPTCPTVSGERTVEIVYPPQGTTVVLPRDVDGRHQKLTLRAAHPLPDGCLSWFMDGAWVGTTRGVHTLAVEASHGTHVVEVVDEAGQASRVTMTVVCR